MKQETIKAAKEWIDKEQLENDRYFPEIIKVTSANHFAVKLMPLEHLLAEFAEGQFKEKAVALLKYAGYELLGYAGYELDEKGAIGMLENFEMHEKWKEVENAGLDEKVSKENCPELFKDEEE